MVGKTEPGGLAVECCCAAATRIRDHTNIVRHRVLRRYGNTILLRMNVQTVRRKPRRVTVHLGQFNAKDPMARMAEY